MRVLALLFHCLWLVVGWCIFLKATVSRLFFFLGLQIAMRLDINIADLFRVPKFH